jgi:hypothetical protein
MAFLVIKNGWFHQILGQSVQNDGFVFIPVLGDLNSQLKMHPVSKIVGEAVFPLSDYIKEKSLKILADEQDIFGELVNIGQLQTKSEGDS